MKAKIVSNICTIMGMDVSHLSKVWTDTVLSLVNTLSEEFDSSLRVWNRKSSINCEPSDEALKKED